MALYTDLYNLGGDSTLRNRVQVACIVAAEAIRNESDQTGNHANRLLWAARVFADPSGEATRMLWVLLAQNYTLTTGQITGANDAAIQTGVNNAVNIFATG